MRVFVLKTFFHFGYDGYTETSIRGVFHCENEAIEAAYEVYRDLDLKDPELPHFCMAIEVLWKNELVKGAHVLHSMGVEERGDWGGHELLQALIAYRRGFVESRRAAGLL